MSQLAGHQGPNPFPRPVSHSHCLLMSLAFRKVAIRLLRGTKEHRVTGTTEAYIVGNPAPRPLGTSLSMGYIPELWSMLTSADHTRPCVFVFFPRQTSLWQNLIYKLVAVRIDNTVSQV